MYPVQPGMFARLWFAALLLLSPGGRADAQSSHESAPFSCHASLFGTCHFAIVRDGEIRYRFDLPHGKSKTVDDVSPMRDFYMVSVNFEPPANPAKCSRTPVDGAKRSYWCKLKMVSGDFND